MWEKCFQVTGMVQCDQLLLLRVADRHDVADRLVKGMVQCGEKCFPVTGMVQCGKKCFRDRHGAM